MKKFLIATGLIGVFALGSIAVSPANGVRSSAGYAATTESSSAATRTADRLRALNMELSPDDAIVDDWLCDGMTPCVELSPR
jgi:hypothetical protein